jgi:hypothetical protein
MHVVPRRLHVARNVYKQALALIKASRENDEDGPTIEKLSARLYYQDAKVDIRQGLVEVALRDKHYLLRLEQRRGTSPSSRT